MANLIEELQQELLSAKKLIGSQEKTIATLKEQVKLLLANRYAKSSEKYVDPNVKQGDLFNEADFEGETPVEPEEESIDIPAHQRTVRRGKRTKLPDYLPRVRVEHHLPETELIGPNGEVFEMIGEVITEQLDIIPAQVRVIENVCFKYAVKGREELGIRTAAMPKQPIPKSIATPGLLAHIATAKYSHHLPLYRQERIWESLDVNLPRNTLGRWMITMGEQVQNLVDYLMEEIKSHGHIHADETPVVVLEKKPPDKNRHKGYMWVYTNRKGTVFDYQTTRGGQHPAKMLEDFTGYLQTDAYSAYDQFQSSEAIKLVGCFAHARRYFMDVRKAAGKKKNTPVVDYVLKLIAKLYKLEAKAKQEAMDADAIYQMRQTDALPILEKLYEYLLKTKPRVPPKSLLGKAVNYALNHWQELQRYTDNGILNIDNNPAEREIKPFVIGRKNWLFCGNIRGAKAAANLYSLVESAKVFDLKVFDYLKYVFEHLPNADTPKKLEQLLPQYAQEHVPKIIVSSS